MRCLDPTPDPTADPTAWPPAPAAVPAGASIAELAADMIERGVRRVHVLAWRDLDDPDAGGSEVHADELMRRWATAGLEITHRTSAAVGRTATARRHGYQVIRRGSRYSVFPRTILGEATQRMGPYDALLEVWNGVPWFSPVWCRRPRITFVHHVHGPMWDQIMPKPLAGLGRALEARVAPPFYRRTHVLTPSDATRDELLKLGFRPQLVTAVPNGIGAQFTPGGERSPTPLVVAVGRFAPVKRFDELIEAAVIARGRVPDLQLLLVGDGPMRAELDAAVARHDAAGWITFAGHVAHDDLVALYRRAWLASSASLAEGWGLTITEAAACGTAAVVTDINGHRSSVVDGVTGVLAPLERLGDALADVLLDDHRRDELAAAALARARTLTWESAATKVLSALRAQVVRRPPQR